MTDFSWLYGDAPVGVCPTCRFPVPISHDGKDCDECSWNRPEWKRSAS